jgi:glycosyltransferase involved in cell wall biosynthesis
MNRTIYADLRCLQDSAYQFRGIGSHLAALLRTRRQSAFATWKTVGLSDPCLPPMPSEYTALVDQVSSSVNPSSGSEPAVFIDGSPMTHDPRFTLRLQNYRGFIRAGVLYDFIPLDWPGYLPRVADRVTYLAKVAHLRKLDRFFPISEYTGRRLVELLAVSQSRIHVTGASVRSSLYAHRKLLSFVSSPYDEPYFLTVGGGDIRKNTEAAVKAVRRLNLLYARLIPLKVIGHYGDDHKRELFQLACHAEGAGFLEFCPGVSDEELVSLLSGAIATIAPSHIEGFSLPVVEASVCGCPVVASTCSAQMELIEQAEALFRSADAVSLSEKLDALLNQPALRSSLVEAQAHLGPKFHEDAVGGRFWNGLAGAVEKHCGSAAMGAPMINGGKKPMLAFLSPYPPDQSGVARHTATMMRASEKLFDSDLYTDAIRPLTFDGRFRDAGPVSVAPLLGAQYNGVVSVLGNSPYHTRIFQVFERFGGPCILHDARLTHIYSERLGQQGFLKFAARLLGRPVSTEEVNVWLQDRNLPSLFLEPIIERASPLIVQTVTQQAEIKKRYGVDVEVAAPCALDFFSDDELTPARKQAARKRLDIPAATFLVSSFGYVLRSKGMESCILAAELLRSWKIPASLYFVGSAGVLKTEVERIAALYGISKYVHCLPDFVDDAVYRDFLIASDAAVQLRSYGFGQVSSALADCISAGLPTVASSELAQSCDAPDYVSKVPDRFSPLHVAEELAALWETRKASAAHTESRAAYLKTHNFEYYGRRLLEILGVA